MRLTYILQETFEIGELFLFSRQGLKEIRRQGAHNVLQPVAAQIQYWGFAVEVRGERTIAQLVHRGVGLAGGGGWMHHPPLNQMANFVVLFWQDDLVLAVGL